MDLSNPDHILGLAVVFAPFATWIILLLMEGGNNGR